MCSSISESQSCGEYLVGPLAPPAARCIPGAPQPPHFRPRPRRSLKVLYPPLVRRPLPREDPDPIRRWLVLLSALVFLQIYTEETACGPPELQPIPPATSLAHPQEGEGCVGTAKAWGGSSMEKPWWLHQVQTGAQLECVVA